MATLIIGLGGTGASIILNIKKALYENERNQLAMTNPPHFICIDANESVKTLQLRVSFTAGTILEDPYTVPNIVMLDPGRGIRPDSFNDVLWFMPPTEKPRLNLINLTGCMGDKKLGRGAALLNAEAIRRMITQEAGGQVCEVYICGSLCGGTGAGSFIEVAYMVKSVLGNNCAALTGLFTLSTLYQGLPAVPNTDANCFASMLELHHFAKLGNAPQPHAVYTQPLVNGAVLTDTRSPFDYVFLFEKSNEKNVSTNLEGIASIVGRFIISMSNNKFLLSVVNNERGKFSYNKAPNRAGLPVLTPGGNPYNNQFRAYGGAGYFAFRYPKKEIQYARAALLSINIIDDLCGAHTNILDHVKMATEFMKNTTFPIYWDRASPKTGFGKPFFDHLDRIIAGPNAILGIMMHSKTLTDAVNTVNNTFQNICRKDLDDLAPRLRTTRHSLLKDLDERLDALEKECVGMADTTTGQIYKGGLNYIIDVLQYIYMEAKKDIEDLRGLYQSALNAEALILAQLTIRVGLLQNIEPRLNIISTYYYQKLCAPVYREMLLTLEGDTTDNALKAYTDGVLKTVERHKAILEKRLEALMGDPARKLRGFRDDLLDIVHNVKMITDIDSAVVLLFNSDKDIDEFYRLHYIVAGNLSGVVYSDLMKKLAVSFQADFDSLFKKNPQGGTEEILKSEDKRRFLDIAADFIERDFDGFRIEEVLYRQYPTVAATGDLDIPVVRQGETVSAFNCCSSFLRIDKNTLLELGIPRGNLYVTSLVAGIPRSCMPCNPNQPNNDCNYSICNICPMTSADASFQPHACFGYKLAVQRVAQAARLGFMYGIDLIDDPYSIRLASAIGGLLPQGLTTVMACKEDFDLDRSRSMIPFDKLDDLDAPVSVT